MKALILVDLQNDFMPGGALAVPEGDQVVAVVNRLQANFDIVVATQDWHPANHGSFASQHAGRRVGEQIDLNGLPQILWPDHCIQQTPGAALVTGLDTSRIARIFYKGTAPDIDSYSAFFDNGHRQATGLGDYLQARGVTDVYLAGLATDYCVKYSALDAQQLPFTVHVIADACRAVNLQPGDGDRALEALCQAGIKIVNSANVQPSETPEVIAATKYLRLLRRGRWEYVERTNVTGIVVIVAVNTAGELVLVEQYRPPLDRRVIELPAGLAGDVAGAESEALEEAARRELLEETGYLAGDLARQFHGPPSAGITSEEVTFFLARDVRRISNGGGDESEEIAVHCVPLAQVPEWLDEQSRQGKAIDVKVYAGLWCAGRQVS
jgi:nicotinamidase/pyrazinamidase